jgi:hypothetical protein
MDTIVKYRFDREMVAFVKTLDVKTAMFGYDKSDVYSKFKDLLVRARDVCLELVMEEQERFEALRTSLLQVADDPEAVRALLYDWEPGSHSLEPGLVTENVPAAIPETEALAEEVPPSAPDQDKQALLDRLEELEARQELLDRAHDIVSEARLEREAIIRKAQTMAEEELFLYRAKRRDEESEFLAQLDRLEADKADLEAACGRYRDFLDEGQSLFDRLQSYAAEIDDIKGEINMPKKEEDRSLPLTELDPPVLSVDRHMGCTEESMPLCELAEESPEGIFPDLDAPAEQPDLENQPEATEPQDSCEEAD